ncbi:MAG: PD-(D/E)XK nuclease family protein [Lachnospiraceae bacterium]
MSLQMIFGGSGSGKSNDVYNEIIEESQKNPEKTFFVLVPEQFTMETQRDFVLLQKNNSIMNIDIVSFNRLAYRIFDELGLGNIHVLEETGKNLVLRKVAEEQQEQLQLMKSSMKKAGYISEVKSVISELTQYGIEPQQLDIFVENSQQSPLFCYKIQDIQTMYQGFINYLEGKFITAEELLDVLAQVAKQSKLLQNAVIVLDGFTGFTPVQYHLLEELLEITEKMIVTITLDERENPYQCNGIQELFYMSKKTIATLQEIANKTHTKVEEPCWISYSNESRFGHSPGLQWLEQNLFRQNAAPYQGATQEIAMHSLLNPRQELTFIAREIKRLVREETYRYKDIAIVCGDVEQYAKYAEEIFHQYEIPLFLDAKKNIVFHPMTEFLKSVLLLLEQDFSYDTVVAYLRSGLSGISREDTDLLENYLLAQGIRGSSKWKKSWVRKSGVQTPEELMKINELREIILEHFLPIQNIFHGKKAQVQEISKMLYELIVNLQIQEQLKSYELKFQEQGENTLAKEYAQIYKIVMDLLDKMVGLLGEEEMTIREYREILEAGLEASTVGIIPPGYDRVVFGDIERSRLTNVKILFLAGVNDGMIPKASEHGGIISQSDRECFKEFGMELAPTDRERSFIQNFYLYLNLTKPSEKLYITWFRVNQEGKETRRSYLAGMIEKLFPKVSVIRQENSMGIENIVTPSASMGYFVEGLKRAKKGTITPEWAGLYQWFTSHAQWQDKIMPLVEASFYQFYEKPMGSEITHALYGTVLENSVTRLEQFSACACSHFLQYGLKLEERNLGEFAPVDMGSLFHEALEHYSAAMEQAGYHWFDVPETVQEELMLQAVEETISGAADTLLFHDARTSYLVERIKRILKRTIESIAYQVKSSQFAPEGYEISFSFAENLEAVNFALSEEEKMRLKGRIDRIDTYKTQEKVYVKVIDYKSGNKQFQLLSLYHGLQLQLVVYLNSAMELMKQKYPDKEILPGGMYYYHLDDPVVEGDSGKTDIEIKEKILEELKLKGVSSEEEDESVNKKSQKADSDQFRILSNYVNHKIKKIGKDIFSGEIKAAPYQLGDSTGCDYCPYHGICGFDPSMPGQEYRKLENIKDQDVLLEKMQKEI